MPRVILEETCGFSLPLPLYQPPTVTGEYWLLLLDTAYKEGSKVPLKELRSLINPPTIVASKKLFGWCKGSGRGCIV